MSLPTKKNLERKILLFQRNTLHPCKSRIDNVYYYDVFV